MFWTILALFMTAVMGGLIAYNGDLMGRRFGKRRVTLFNLRPKHTAILITSVTGFVISALTTVALFLLVKPVRVIILEGEEAIREKARLSKDLTSLKSENQATLRANSELKTRQAELLASADDAKRKLGDAQRRLEFTADRVRYFETRLSTAQAKLVQAETRVKAAQSKNEILREHNERLAEINKKLADTNFSLETQKRDLDQTNRQLAKDIEKKSQEYTRLDSANSVLAKQNEELVRENTNLDKQNRSALAVNRKLLDENYRLDDDNRALQTKYGSLQTKYASLQTEVNQYEQKTDQDLTSLRSRFRAMKTRQVSIRVGEDLSRRVVPAQATADEVRKTLQALVHDANDAAISKGAASLEPTSPRAVKVMSKQILTTTSEGNPVTFQVSEEDRTNAIVNKLAGSPVPVCVLAVAVENSVEGEPASIDFQPFNDRMVYSKGKVVAAPRRMNAADPPARIYTELVGFLKDLGQSAIERGMIPRIDPSTGSPQVGALEWPELVDLADRVRSFGRFVKVTAIAADDTNASDPLKLQFRIDPSL